MKSFITFMSEMAKDIGEKSYNPLDKEEKRKEFYNRSRDDSEHKFPSMDNNVTLQRRVKIDYNGEKQTEYHVNDHDKKEATFRSVIVTHRPTQELPFKHDEQIAIDRQTGVDLPRGFGRDVIYNHFENSEHPLRSSDIQFHAGHKMWHDIAHRALADGHHVYFHDGRKLYKSNEQNLDKHLAASFGKHDDYTNKHIILSKTELGK